MHSPTVPPSAAPVVNPADDQHLQDIDAANNLVELFLKRADEKGDTPFLGRKSDGEWVTQSWREVADEVCLLAESLRRIGLNDGDRVALVSENRPNGASPISRLWRRAAFRCRPTSPTPSAITAIFSTIRVRES